MNTKNIMGKRIISLFLAFSIVMTMVPNISLAAYADNSTIQRSESNIKNSDMLKATK